MIDRDGRDQGVAHRVGRRTGYRERFRREAHTAAQLTHPNIIPIHDTGEIDGRLYLVMPVINGIDLHSLLKRDGPMSPPRAVRIIEQLAAALDAAHEAGLVHRDVKPSNALMTGHDFVYLIDFGIAHDAAATRLTSTGTMVGTLAYMAPERFNTGTPTPEPTSTPWPVCCMKCLTGATPYPGDSIEQQIAGHLTPTRPNPPASTPPCRPGSMRSSPPAWPKTPTSATRAPPSWPPPPTTPSPRPPHQPTPRAPPPTLLDDPTPAPPAARRAATARRPAPRRDPTTPTRPAACPTTPPCRPDAPSDRHTAAFVGPAPTAAAARTGAPQRHALDHRRCRGRSRCRARRLPDHTGIADQRNGIADRGTSASQTATTASQTAATASQTTASASQTAASAAPVR